MIIFYQPPLPSLKANDINGHAGSSDIIKLPNYVWSRQFIKTPWPKTDDVKHMVDDVGNIIQARTLEDGFQVDSLLPYHILNCRFTLIHFDKIVIYHLVSIIRVRLSNNYCSNFKIFYFSTSGNLYFKACQAIVTLTVNSIIRQPTGTFEARFGRRATRALVDWLRQVSISFPNLFNLVEFKSVLTDSHFKINSFISCSLLYVLSFYKEYPVVKKY